MNCDNDCCLIFQKKQISLGPEIFWPPEKIVPPAQTLRLTLETTEGQRITALWGESWWPGPWTELRSAAGLLPPDQWKLVTRAFTLLNWRKDNQFCGVCGARMTDHPQERALLCPACGYTSWPRITPAVIVLITRNEEVLLGHNQNHPPGVFSLLAGYVEPGESAEEAVHREVYEEARIEIHQLRYLESVPWPFPDNLMLAFHAEYKSGTPQPDGKEILELGWFPRDRLPNLPPAGSLARRLLEQWHRGG